MSPGLDLRGLTPERSEIEETSPPDFPAGNYFNLLQPRAVEREGFLNSDVVRYLPDGKRGVREIPTGPLDDDALEHLNSLLVSLNDASVDSDRITRTKRWDV